MKKGMVFLLAAVLSIVSLAAISGSTAQAATVPLVQAGDYLQLSTPNGLASGAELIATIYQLDGNVFTPTGSTFSAYFLDVDESLDFTSYFCIESILGQTINRGGQGSSRFVGEHAARPEAHFAAGFLGNHGTGSSAHPPMGPWHPEQETTWGATDGQAIVRVTHTNDYMAGWGRRNYDVWVMNPVTLLSYEPPAEEQGEIPYQPEPEEEVPYQTQPVPVPEPGTFMLLGMGLLGLAGASRMRKGRGEA